MNICIYGSASDLIGRDYLTAGETLGRAIARHGHAVVFGGGAEGMMGAVARGMHELGGKLIGISPSFFKVDGALYDGCDEFIFTETLQERKTLLENRSDAFLITPGGVGTFDEFFEVFSLRQLGRHHKPIAFYNINGYFDPLIDLLHKTAERKFMKPSNLSLYESFVTPEPAITYFEEYQAADADIAYYR